MIMELYPLKFRPIYKDKIWGGRNLERLYGRDLPDGQPIGESWELSDLDQGVSLIANGPLAGMGLDELTATAGERLLGDAACTEDGRFPLLLKLLDANDILSLQVHPDQKAIREIPGSALKTECWYIVESRGGFIYKGVRPGVTAADFGQAVKSDHVTDLVQRFDVAAGDFHYLPAGTVHALGSGVVVAEVQTPSDTTYRVTDWGRGREIHVERSMRCIRFDQSYDAPGASGQALLATEFFRVDRQSVAAGGSCTFAGPRCRALMMLTGQAMLRHENRSQPHVQANAGDTILLPADLRNVRLEATVACGFLDITLPPRQA